MFFSKKKKKKKKKKKNIFFFFFFFFYIGLFFIQSKAKYKSEQSLMRCVLSFLDEVYIGVMLSRFEYYMRVHSRRRVTRVYSSFTGIPMQHREKNENCHQQPSNL